MSQQVSVPIDITGIRELLPHRYPFLLIDRVVELEPGKRIRYTDSFDDPKLPGEMRVTITLTQVLCGTDLAIEQAGIPAVIPVEMCYLGWQESLMQLATLVEPEIPSE